MIEQMPAEAYQMGTPLAVYRPKPIRQYSSKIGGTLMCLIGVAIVFFDMAQYHPSGMYIVGGVLLALGMWALYTGIREQGLQVLVFPDGLAYTARGATQLIRWDDVAEVQQQVTKHYTNGVYTGTTHIYKLRRSGQPEIKFNDALQNVEQLGTTIQEETYRRLLPRAIAAYNAGTVVQFGKLSVSAQGLSNGKETLAWSEVKGIKLDKGVIAVSKQGKWLNWTTATVAQTPNIFVFTALVDAIIGINK
ncbi:MAG: hypothetical protein IPP13_02355 [Kouleothrix sp.]|jgi:hypothetical protein|nr:hypothetical protein [Kouleothrix sp.]